MRAMERTALGATALPATPVGFGGAPFTLLGEPASTSDPLLMPVPSVGLARNGTRRFVLAPMRCELLLPEVGYRTES